MSLLDNGPHAVTVTVMTGTKNQYNGWDLTPAGDPISVSGVSVQPVTDEEVASSGGTIEITSKRIIGRGPWPGGVHSVVHWNGRDWDQQGEARIYGMSERTGHFDVIVHSRSSEVK